jgi:hypothetical protein
MSVRTIKEIHYRLLANHSLTDKAAVEIESNRNGVDEAAIRLSVQQQERVTAKKKIFFRPTLVRQTDARQRTRMSANGY